MAITRQTLSNGLTFIHIPMPDTEMVALSVCYHVGAKNEDEQHTGYAHLLEHLMFTGTPRIPDYDERVQYAGGENNAYTNNDLTMFYITVPAEHAEEAFLWESDRMMGLTLDGRSVEVQKQVVIEEFKQRYLNQPYGDAQHLLRALAYRRHSYRWPAIGLDPQQIACATADDIRRFYRRYYLPSNAIVTVTGAIALADAQRLAERYFSPIPSPSGEGYGRLAETRPDGSPIPSEPVQQRLRRRTVHRDVPQDMLLMAFHMPERRHPDFPVFDLITDLLSGGQSGRLATRLVNEQRIFTSMDSYIMGSEAPGLLYVTGRIAPSHTPQEAEEAVWQEIGRLKSEVVDEHEMEKVRNHFESERVFNGMSYLNVALNVPQMALMGDTPESEIERFRAVTADDVRRVARQALTKRNASVIYYLGNHFTTTLRPSTM